MAMKTLKKLAAFAAVVSVLVLTSCSSKDAAIQSSIPSDSWAVISVNAGKVLKSLDCHIEDGKFAMPRAMQERLNLSNEDGSVLANIGALGEVVEYESIYMVLANDNDQYLTFALKDAQAFGEALTTRLNMKPAEVSGFDAAYTTGGWESILVREQQAWYVSRKPEKAAELISAQLKRAENGNFTQVPGVSDLLGSADNMIKAAVSLDALSSVSGVKGQPGSWQYLTADVKDNALVVKGCNYNSEGSRVEMEGYEKIDLDFLRYVPGDFNLALAIGIDDDFDWDTLFANLSQVGGLQAQGIVEMLKPYFKAIDGTLAIAARVPSTAAQLSALQRGDLSSIGLVAMAHMDQNRVNEAVTNIKSAIESSGMRPTQDANGVYSINAGMGLSVYFGSVDGYLAISTIPLQPTGNNSLTPVFEGKECAGVFTISNISTFVPGINANYGAEIKMQGNGETMEMQLTLPGCKDDIVPALIYMLSGK